MAPKQDPKPKFQEGECGGPGGGRRPRPGGCGVGKGGARGGGES